MEIFLAHPVPVAVAAAVFGAVIGSFLNVVTFRLPVMMGLVERTREGPLNLVGPASHCPACGHAIRPWENVPIFSYVILRGKCSACGAGISPQYPLVEAGTALVSALLSLHFGPSWQLLAALVLFWALICILVIDLRHQIIPDVISLPLVAVGLGVNAFGLFTSVADAAIGAAAGYGSFWCLYWAVRLATGKEGLGYGDFKLFAALGAWMGWKMLPVVLFIASGTGAVIGIGLIALGRHGRGRAIAFGPFLAVGGALTFLWGETMWESYWRFLAGY